MCTLNGLVTIATIATVAALAGCTPKTVASRSAPDPISSPPAPAAACTGEADIRSGPSDGHFPILLPVANADPSVRRAEIFRVPTRLSARSSEDHVEVELDPEALEFVSLEVGCHMLVGAEVRFGPAGSGADASTGSIGLGGADFSRAHGRSPFIVPHTKDAPSGPALYRAQITLFETDIPPQHMWEPRDGRFRILLQRSFEVELPTRP